jgi:hypothetical protein
MTERRKKNNNNNNHMNAILAAVIASILMMVSVAIFNNNNNNNSIPLPIANAQKSDTEMGTIASIQNEKDGKPAWVTSGVWDFKNINSNSPMFNATFNMFMLNGSAAHKHTITDFKINGKPTKSNNATTYNGTATVSLKKGPATGVPISIKLMGNSAISIWVDPSKTENHFGNTPIYGAQHRIT